MTGKEGEVSVTSKHHLAPRPPLLDKFISFVGAESAIYHLLGVKTSFHVKHYLEFSQTGRITNKVMLPIAPVLVRDRCGAFKTRLKGVNWQFESLLFIYK